MSAYWREGYGLGRKQIHDAVIRKQAPKEMGFSLDIEPTPLALYELHWKLRCNDWVIAEGESDFILKAKLDARLAKRKFLRELKKLVRLRNYQNRHIKIGRRSK